MSPSDNPFDWHDYAAVEISDAKFAQLVVASLDQIASTPEGRDLLERGKANIAQSAALLAETPIHPREDNKITVSDKPPTDAKVNIGSYDNPVLGFVTLDPKQIGKIGYLTSQGDLQVMNLTDIAVHELFHQADPNITLSTLMRETKANSANVIFVQEKDPEKAAALRKAIAKSAVEILLAQKGLPDLTAMTPDQQKAFMSNPDNVQKLAQFALDIGQHPEMLASHKGEIADKLHISPDSFNFFTAEDVKKLGEKSIDPKTGAPIFEESATVYTDAWIQKYFSEPPRVEYMQAGNLTAEAQQEPRVYPFACGQNTQVEYHNIAPETLSQMPQMSSTPCIAVKKSPAR